MDSDRVPRYWPESTNKLPGEGKSGEHTNRRNGQIQLQVWERLERWTPNTPDGLYAAADNGVKAGNP